MHALALLAGTSAASFPYFRLGALDLGVPIQAFGMIVAAGVLIGATPLRRYAEWHGVSDERIRSLLTWIMISGFLGAHELEIVAYRGWGELFATQDNDPSTWWFLGHALWPSNWPLMFRFWDGIASFGGFVGGALGFLIFVWWKRLPRALFADITIIGLLPAFSIGRIGCTVVSDHIGAAVDPGAWYRFLAMDYPVSGVPHNLWPSTVNKLTDPNTIIPMWNLGLVELLYLIPVNAIVLSLAFRAKKRMPAGFIAVLTAVLYTPVRFFLEFLRPEETDPRHLGLTFAQWGALVAFAAALYFARRILKTGVAAEIVAPTSREAQERLRIILREDKDADADDAAPSKPNAEEPKAEVARRDAPDDDADDDEPDDEADEAAADEKPAPTKPAAGKPAKPAGVRSGNKKKSRKR